MGASGKTRFELIGPRSPEALICQCRSAGMRIGRTGSAVMRAVAQAQDPFDFDAVWAGARQIEPAISRDTIYRSLRRLRSVGLIRDHTLNTR
ncbi:MAG: transcriptional repressor [Rhizomicrobium sp.]